LRILSALCIVASVLSCTKDDTKGSGSSSKSLSVELSPSSIGAEGGSVTATVSWSHLKWKISESGSSYASDFSVTYAGSTSTEGKTSVTFSVAANKSQSSRSFTIMVQDTEGSLSKTVTMTQEGVQPKVVAISTDKSVKYQSIDGFGAMNNWGDNSYLSQSECDLLFGDLGLNIMRIRISPTETNWSNVRSACVYPYEKYGIRILASPWTMPSQWKDPQQIEAKKDGVSSYLKEDYYEEYALYLEKFAAYMAEGGAPLYAISMQNEPDWDAEYEGCRWTAEQMCKFLGNYGALVKSALLASGESLNFNQSFYSPTLSDSKASENVDIIAGHLYGSTPKSFSKAGGKRIWMTEHLLNDSWNNNTSHWDETMDMVEEVSACMKAGWNAYIWWYGRRYYSFIGDGEQGTSTGTILSRGHAFGQFSRYVKEGYGRIKVDVQGDDSIDATAYRGDGKTVIVLINPSSSDIDNVSIDASGYKSASATRTSEKENCKKVACSISGGALSISLAGSSITTIVLED